MVDYYQQLTQQGLEAYLIAAENADDTITDLQQTLLADFTEQLYYPPAEP